MNNKNSKYPGLNLGAEHGGDHDTAENAVFGFWIFLMSDMVTFGMFFAVYATNLHKLAGGPGPKELFSIGSVAWQTAFLLVSSLTSGLCVLSLKHGHTQRDASRRWLVIWMLVTVLLGLGFLQQEIRDFISIAHDGGVPTRSAWLSSFWSLVGMHGLHVSAGCLWCLVIVAGVLIQGVNTRWKHALMRWAVFWHFLDLVWIGIFSFVFLGGLV